MCEHFYQLRRVLITPYLYVLCNAKEGETANLCVEIRENVTILHMIHSMMALLEQPV